jgi:hypothetical protein
MRTLSRSKRRKSKKKSGMISSRKLQANRSNARASTGPRTPTGKARAARNAQKHGLSVPSMADPSLAAEAKILAREIAGEGANEQLQQLAARIAEAQIDLLRVRRARRELLSRAQLDPEPEPSLPPDWDIELSRRWGCEKPVRMPRTLKRSIEKTVEEAVFGPPLADCAARLAAMDRYEKRALSRRKFAIREFDAARKALA